MLARGKELLGRSVDLAALDKLDISTEEGGNGRQELFQNTLIAQVDKQGLAAQVSALDQQIFQLEKRLKSLAQNGSALESLNRDVKIAEAVFSATLARLDLSRADLFGSYPQTQLVTEPSIPTGNAPLKAKLALVGALFGSFLITTALSTLFVRDLKINRRRLSETYLVENEPHGINVEDEMTGNKGEMVSGS